MRVIITCLWRCWSSSNVSSLLNKLSSSSFVFNPCQIALILRAGEGRSRINMLVYVCLCLTIKRQNDFRLTFCYRLVIVERFTNDIVDNSCGRLKRYYANNYYVGFILDVKEPDMLIMTTKLSNNLYIDYEKQDERQNVTFLECKGSFYILSNTKQ